MDPAWAFVRCQTQLSSYSPPPPMTHPQLPFPNVPGVLAGAAQRLCHHCKSWVFYLFRQGLVDPSWPQTHYIAEVGLEFLTLLPLPRKCWDYKSMPPNLVPFPNLYVPRDFKWRETLPRAFMRVTIRVNLTQYNAIMTQIQ